MEGHGFYAAHSAPQHAAAALAFPPARPRRRRVCPEHSRSTGRIARSRSRARCQAVVSEAVESGQRERLLLGASSQEVHRERTQRIIALRHELEGGLGQRGERDALALDVLPSSLAAALSSISHSRPS